MSWSERARKYHKAVTIVGARATYTRGRIADKGNTGGNFSQKGGRARESYFRPLRRSDDADRRVEGTTKWWISPSVPAGDGDTACPFANRDESDPDENNARSRLRAVSDVFRPTESHGPAGLGDNSPTHRSATPFCQGLRNDVLTVFKFSDATISLTWLSNLASRSFMRYLHFVS